MDTAAPATRPEIALEAADSGSAAAGSRRSLSEVSMWSADTFSASLLIVVAVGSAAEGGQRWGARDAKRARLGG